MKGRVIILTPSPPECPGGAEHFVRALSTELSTKGYGVEVFHWGNSAPQWARHLSGRLGVKISGTLNGWFVGRKARQKMGKDVVAVISHSTVGYYPLQRSLGHPKLIHVYHGTYRGQAEAIRKWISYGGYLYMKWWDSMILERLSGTGKTVLCNSWQTQEEAFRFFGLNGINVGVPLDTERYRPLDPSTCRASLDLPVHRTIGLFVGSTQPTKGFNLVESVIARLPQICWCLLLRGEAPATLKHRENIRIFQDVSPERVPEFYTAADFLLAPSNYEAFGYAIVESLACGTPVIATPGGASRLFLSGDPLRRLLISDSDSAEPFIEAVRDVERNLDLFKKVVAENVRPEIEALMAPENWRRTLFEATGL